VLSEYEVVVIGWWCVQRRRRPTSRRRLSVDEVWTSPGGRKTASSTLPEPHSPCITGV